MKQKDLISGSIIGNILDFSLPFLLSYLLQMLYGMADLFIVAQYNGVDSTTAVSIGSLILKMVTVVIIGLSMGSMVIIAKAIGERNEENFKTAVGNTFSIFLIFSILVTIILLILIKPIVNIISTPTEAIEQTITYLFIGFIGIPFIVAYNILSSIFRGMGDTKSPLFFVTIACVLNIILDYIFIGYYKIGATGAALGTVLSQIGSVIISIYFIRKKKLIRSFQISDLKLKKAMIKAILKIGIPIAFQDGFIQASFVIITIFANLRGLNDAAAVGIVEKIISILFMVPSTMLSTVSALSAQNIGAGKQKRAQEILKISIIITVSISLILAFLMTIFAEDSMKLFTNNSKVILAGSQYMKAYVWDSVFAGVHFCMSGYFCAISMSNISFLHNIISIVVARIPIAYWASRKFTNTLFPMGLAAVIGSIISIIICVVAYQILEKRAYKNFFNLA
ncbi:MAG: MATE family efflux transporter [Fusobacterium gastrosuis]|uniref:MATE family efflux transporter n=1 Tax=Fusobacterium TaxID=848 RepID=UPI0025C35307|nr:MATE family efflux transporter [Fusobacterium sp.]MDD7391735.1 MATE family efflux transporter [Fusobacteriaceae bacterium]MDY4011936.1 MATE family efflux transporter [Fusobacterium gastrosuis]MCI5725410.1 MATE family efflux transporter [Fusobacterium sp.]MCI7224034.1 MATE family efflux transporter [Fusobacterium sp.]MDY5305208.1 MATE family efflux transporter [Fusobacterium gastrosuis]